MPWVDELFVRLHDTETNMDGPPEQQLPLVRRACESGKGIMGRKVVGCRELASGPVRAARFVMETGCVHAFTIGPTEIGHREHVAGIVSRLQGAGDGRGPFVDRRCAG